VAPQNHRLADNPLFVRSGISETGLARHIRADIIDENHRAVGPGGGVDTGAILRHPIAATAYQSLRAFGLVIAIFLAIIGIWQVTTVRQAVIDSCAANPENSCRHCTHIQITGWRGELVVGIFLRLVLLQRSLFVETNYTVLTPLSQECYEIDAIPSVVTIGGIVRLAGQAAVQLPAAALHAIPDLARLCWQPIAAWRHDSAEERLIKADLAFD
jgi:hypothetical protein